MAVITAAEASLAFNRMVNDQAYILSATRKPIFWLLMGNQMEGKYITLRPDNDKPYQVAEFERLKSANGAEFEFQAVFGTLTVSNVADTAAAIAVVSSVQTPVSPINSTFQLSEFSSKVGLEYWTKYKTGGDLQKATSYLDTQKETLIGGVQTKIATDFYNTSTSRAGARANLATIHTIVDDSNTYGYDRTDSTYANWKAKVDPVNAPLTWKRVRTNRVDRQQYGGDPNLIITGQTAYNDLYDQLEGKSIITNAGDLLKYGGEHFIYAGIKSMVDYQCTANYAFQLDPTHWYSAFNQRGMVTQIFENVPLLNASDLITLNFLFGVGCRNTATQVKYSGLQNG